MSHSDHSIFQITVRAYKCDLLSNFLFDKSNKALQIVRCIAKSDALGSIFVPPLHLFVDGLPLAEFFDGRRYAPTHLLWFYGVSIWLD